jgi:hypothetical protein
MSAFCSEFVLQLTWNALFSEDENISVDPKTFRPSLSNST